MNPVWSAFKSTSGRGALLEVVGRRCGGAIWDEALCWLGCWWDGSAWWGWGGARPICAMSGEDGAGPALDAEVGARCNDECEWLECLVWTADDVDDANEAEGGCRRVRTVGSA